jgi:hypothetical protein
LINVPLVFDTEKRTHFDRRVIGEMVGFLTVRFGLWCREIDALFYEPGCQLRWQLSAV